jgi:hypothetical protein
MTQRLSRRRWRTTATKGDGIFTTRPFAAGDTLLVGRIEKKLSKRDLCITLILAKIWEFTIDFIVKNLMKFANIELCRGL